MCQENSQSVLTYISLIRGIPNVEITFIIFLANQINSHKIIIYQQVMLSQYWRFPIVTKKNVHTTVNPWPQSQQSYSRIVTIQKIRKVMMKLFVYWTNKPVASGAEKDSVTSWWLMITLDFPSWWSVSVVVLIILILDILYLTVVFTFHVHT